MTPLSLCLPYYKNPRMLAEQYRVWAEYPADVKAGVEVVLVDDGSPADAAAAPVARPEGLPALRIYRVLVDIPWHQHGARNLAAREATGDWLLLTDMDHVVPAETLRGLAPILAAALPAEVFTFARVDAPHGRPTVNERGEAKPHVNSFAVRRDHFWTVGGYDEDCVGYGTDGYFRTRLKALSRMCHLEELALVRYPREVIADASTFEPGVEPRAFRDAGRRGSETRRRLMEKRLRWEAPKVLDFPWERVL